MRNIHFKNFCRLLENLVKNVPLSSDQLKRKFATASKSDSGNGSKNAPVKISNTPHPPKDPPENYNPSELNHNAFKVPDYIPLSTFRPFVSSSEILGPQAGKCNEYKNPEYYSYHRYSFAALQALAIKLREESMNEGGLRIIYEYSDSDDDDSDNRDEMQCPPPTADKDNTKK